MLYVHLISCVDSVMLHLDCDGIFKKTEQNINKTVCEKDVHNPELKGMRARKY